MRLIEEKREKWTMRTYVPVSLDKRSLAA